MSNFLTVIKNAFTNMFPTREYEYYNDGKIKCIIYKSNIYIEINKYYKSGELKYIIYKTNDYIKINKYYKNMVVQLNKEYRGNKIKYYCKYSNNGRKLHEIFYKDAVDVDKTIEIIYGNNLNVITRKYYSDKNHITEETMRNGLRINTRFLIKKHDENNEVIDNIFDKDLESDEPVPLSVALNIELVHEYQEIFYASGNKYQETVYKNTPNNKIINIYSYKDTPEGILDTYVCYINDVRHMMI